MTTQPKPLEEISFQIILHSGNARSFAMEGVQLAKKENSQQRANVSNKQTTNSTKPTMHKRVCCKVKLEAIKLPLLFC